MTRRNNLTKRGFTVLEVTIAVSVIAILAGLLIYGISHLTASGKANSTKIMLQNNRGMLKSLIQRLWDWADPSTFGLGSICKLETFTLPQPIPLILALSAATTFGPAASPIPPSAGPASPLCAPSGPWTNDSVGFANRNGSYAVLYTQLAMRMIGSISAAKTMMAGIPTGSTMVPVWINGSPLRPGQCRQVSNGQ